MQFCLGIAPETPLTRDGDIMINRPTPTGIPASTMAGVDPMLPLHFESNIEVQAAAGDIFNLLDDHGRLSAHMTRPSWMMAGSVMTLEFDASNGRAVGALIRLTGRVLGIPLSVEEVVTERNPPQRKVWNTIGRPQLIVIGAYRMGYEIKVKSTSSHLHVFIDYALPDGPISYWFGRMFGKIYARWCTQRMTNDAATHFQKTSVNALPYTRGQP